MKSKAVYSTLLLTGFLIGASALSVLAEWTPAKSTPPNCVTDPASPEYAEGCNAPLNTGPSLQKKLGSMWVNFGATALDDIALKLNGKIQIVDFNPLNPAENPAGKVLTADANGVGTWKSGGAGTMPFVAVSKEYYYGCGKFQIPEKWQYCALGSIRHDDDESDSDFTKTVRPISAIDAEGKMTWEVHNSCGNEKLGSGARCFNLSTTLPNPLMVACQADYDHLYNPSNVTWSASASGGEGSYSYSWTQVGGGTLTSGSLSQASYTNKYTAVGDKSATVTVTSGSQSVQCSDSVKIVTAPIFALTCSVDQTSATLNEDVEWTAAASGGYGNYSYVWSGTALTSPGTDVSGNGSAIYRKNFSTTGIKRATVTVKSDSGAGTVLTKTCYKDVTITN